MPSKATLDDIKAYHNNVEKNQISPGYTSRRLSLKTPWQDIRGVTGPACFHHIDLPLAHSAA